MGASQGTPSLNTDLKCSKIRGKDLLDNSNIGAKQLFVDSLVKRGYAVVSLEGEGKEIIQNLFESSSNFFLPETKFQRVSC